MKSSSRHSAEPYQWGDACDGWHLLKGDDPSVIEERMPPGPSEPRHCHVRARQFFCVLEGEAVLEPEGDVLLLSDQGCQPTPAAFEGSAGSHASRRAVGVVVRTT